MKNVFLALNPAQKNNPLSNWPYFLLFCIALALFMALFHLEASVQRRLAALEIWAAENGIIIMDRAVSKFPPAMHIKSVSVPVRGKLIDFTGISLSPGLFPPRIRLEATVLGGSMLARGRIEHIFQPAISEVAFDLRGVSLKGIMELFSGEIPFIEALSGRLAARGNFQPAYSGRGLDWAKFAGQLNISLAGGEISQKLPLLKQNILNNITGEAELGFEGQKCLIRQCELRSGEIYLSAAGSLDAWFAPARTGLNIDTTLRLPPGELVENLVPQRTLARIKKNGLVRARISQTLAKPRLQLEN